MAIFGWRGYLTHCFLALLLQKHCVLTDFVLYSDRVPRKQLQEPREVRITALNKSSDLNPRELSDEPPLNQAEVSHGNTSPNNSFRQFSRGHV